MRKLLALGVGAAGALAWVISCVGDQGIPAGQDGGACFPNGTCATGSGLVCTQVPGGICVPEGSDAASDGGPKNDGNPQGDATTDGSSEADAPIICDPNVDASDLPPYCTSSFSPKLCFLPDASTCVASNGICPGGFTADCVGDGKDGGTCCATGEALVDASCATAIDLIDGSILYSRSGNCIFATNSPAVMLCTSNAPCQKYIDASSVCVPAVYAGSGTSLDGLQTGICK